MRVSTRMLMKRDMVPPERIELSLPKEPDFESGASTNSATEATKKAPIRAS